MRLVGWGGGSANVVDLTGAPLVNTVQPLAFVSCDSGSPDGLLAGNGGAFNHIGQITAYPMDTASASDSDILSEGTGAMRGSKPAFTSAW